MTNASNGKHDFFVSFNRADRAWATWIAWILEENGYSVLFQDWDFKGNFVLEIDRAHKQTRRTLAILSPDYLTSSFTAPEWAARFAQDATSEHDLLIPVRVRECEVEGLLMPIVYVNLLDVAREQARERLLNRVAGIRLKPKEEPLFPGDPLVAAGRSVPAEPRFPVPDHNLPQPNRGFIGRTAELQALSKTLTRTGRSAITQPQAITGLGGIGKTQLVLNYAYTHLADYDLIRWLRAEEPATLAADYVGIAPALGLDPQISDQAALIGAIRAELERRQRFLLVFDNATESASLADYLPRVGAGHVLITSRCRDWEDGVGPLELDVLPEAEAVGLLLGGEPTNSVQRATAAALAEDLGCLPLALAQARAFMRARMVDAVDYRQQLAASRPKVMAWRPKDAAYPLAVAQAWQASADHAARDCPAARELLQLLAFLAPDAIPRDLLGVKPEVLPEDLQDSFDRDTAIEALSRFSLLRIDVGTLAIHRLTQAVTRDELDAAAVRTFSNMALQLVHTALPRRPYEHTNWPAVAALLPHVLVAAESAERLNIDPDAATWALCAVALYHESHAAWTDAEPLYRRVVKIGEKTLAPDHPQLAAWLNNLAQCYKATEHFDEAEPLLRRSLEILRKVPSHGTYPTVLSNLGGLYRKTKRYEEAEMLLKEAIAIDEALRPNHRRLANWLNNLAQIYRKMKRYEEAEPLYRRAVEIGEVTLGPEHPRVAGWLNNLALLYQNTGRHAEAEPLHRRALAIREQALGPEHADVAQSLDNLATLNGETGHYAQAELLHRRALAILDKNLPSDHPNLAASRENCQTACNFDPRSASNVDPRGRLSR